MYARRAAENSLPGVCVSQQRYSGYRTMWILVAFDLPTITKRERKTAQAFRKRLIKNGFSMFQLSVYVRHCASRENALVHSKRVKAFLPQAGKVCIFKITDKQFAAMEVFYGSQRKPEPQAPMQLEMF